MLSGAQPALTAHKHPAAGGSSLCCQRLAVLASTPVTLICWCTRCLVTSSSNATQLACPAPVSGQMAARQRREKGAAATAASSVASNSQVPSMKQRSVPSQKPTSAEVAGGNSKSNSSSAQASDHARSNCSSSNITGDPGPQISVQGCSVSRAQATASEIAERMRPSVGTFAMQKCATQTESIGRRVLLIAQPVYEGNVVQVASGSSLYCGCNCIAVNTCRQHPLQQQPSILASIGTVHQAVMMRVTVTASTPSGC